MVYTEIKERNEKKYYYRVNSVRKNKKVGKERVYVGVDLNEKDLNSKINIADEKLNFQKNLRKMQSIQKMIPRINKVLKKHHIKRAGVFGSYVRGEEKKNSDIDVLIQPPKNMSLIGFVKIQYELEEKIGKKIDLLSYNGLNPLIKKQILKEEVRII